MAKIVPSADAPDEAVHYSFSAGEFDLDAGSVYETTDPTLIGEATAHPWLDVEVAAEQENPPSFTNGVDPTKDPLSAQNPIALQVNDPEAAAAAEAEKWDPNSADVLAIDAGKDQGEPFSFDGVDQTLASHEDVDTNNIQGDFS